MILVDTSVWIDHLHKTDERLTTLLVRVEVATHSMVVGELALGSIQRRSTVLGLLQSLPMSPSASHDEVLGLVEARSLFGRGLSLIDVHLLASTLLEPGTLLWTRDRRLSTAAKTLGVLFNESS
jgi:predicted nucleic acid-binding protein